MIQISCKENLLYINEVKFLDKELLDDSPEKQQKFKDLETQFLERWLDTSSCYVDVNPNHLTPLKWESQDEIQISNILHTPNYDTLLVLVTWYSKKKYSEESDWGETTSSVGMGIIIDSTGKWNFDCKLGTYWLESFTNGGNRVKELSRDLKRLILKGGYLDKNNKVDPTFWYRLGTDKNIWHSLREDNWEKASALRRSKSEYEEMINK